MPRKVWVIDETPRRAHESEASSAATRVRRPTSTAALASSVPTPAGERPRWRADWLRRFPAILALGLLVPGLGLYLLGHRKRAVWALAILGPFATSAGILLHWRELWALGSPGSAARIPANVLETVLLVAGGMAIVTSLAWLIQALDGARRTAATSPSRRRGSLALVLLVVITFGVTTRQDARLAECLDRASATLRSEGMSLIPLALSSAAARLDPATPGYLVNVLEINESIGRTEAAATARRALRQRAAELQAFMPVSTAPSLPHRRETAHAFAGVEADASSTVWSRLRLLIN